MSRQNGRFSSSIQSGRRRSVSSFGIGSSTRVNRRTKVHRIESAKVHRPVTAKGHQGGTPKGHQVRVRSGEAPPLLGGSGNNRIVGVGNGEWLRWVAHEDLLIRRWDTAAS